MEPLRSTLLTTLVEHASSWNPCAQTFIDPSRVEYCSLWTRVEYEWSRYRVAPLLDFLSSGQDIALSSWNSSEQLGVAWIAWNSLE